MPKHRTRIKKLHTTVEHGGWRVTYRILSMDSPKQGWQVVPEVWTREEAARQWLLDKGQEGVMYLLCNVMDAGYVERKQVAELVSGGVDQPF